MSTATAERPALFRDPPRPFGTEDAPRRPLARSDGGGLTLGHQLDRVWEGLTVAGAQAECPLCRSPMTRSGPLAKCCGCGSTLA